MVIDPSGKLLQMDGLLLYFRVLPFSETLFTDYTFSGIALLAVNGVTNLTATTLFFKKKSGGRSWDGIRFYADALDNDSVYNLSDKLFVRILFYFRRFAVRNRIYMFCGNEIVGVCRSRRARFSVDRQ